MKLLQLLCLILAVSLTGCKDGEKAKDVQNTAAEKPTEWMGTYTGTLPCRADCEGLKTEITVNADSTYTLSSQAMGQENEPRVFNGKYHLQSSTGIITLDAEGDHLKFKIEDGRLRKLDKFGEREQAGNEEQYLLNRVG